ncbi:MAG TPA: hypothetical protein VG711_01545 [Phycisphaerales bacterium]|nr:hypothetical protein [Phycisphaerales bacterium]
MAANSPSTSALALLPASPGNLSNVRRALASTGWKCVESTDPAGAFAKLACAVREHVQQVSADKTDAQTSFKLIIVDPAAAPFLPSISNALAKYLPTVELWLLDSVSAALRPAAPRAQGSQSSEMRSDIARDRGTAAESSSVISPKHASTHRTPPRRPTKPVLRLAEVDDEIEDDEVRATEQAAKPDLADSFEGLGGSEPLPGSPPTAKDSDELPPPDPRRLTREEIQMLLGRDRPEDEQ